MVANRVKGEVPIEVEGQTYVMVFDFNAICSVEEVFDLPISEIGQKMADGMRARDLRTLIAAGLQGHHAGLTDVQAGDIISQIGAQTAADKLAEAMQAAFPQAGGAKGTGDPQRPAPSGSTSPAS